MVLALPEASIARHAIETRRVAGSGALRYHGRARRRRTTPQAQLKTLVHWACWTVRQQLTLRRHQARPKPRLGSLCNVSERVYALAMPLVLNWSTPTSKAQEFGGFQPRDERSRNPSLGLQRVGGEPDRGMPVFSGPQRMVAQTSGTFFSTHPQAGCTSKPLSDSAAGASSSFSSRATQSVTC